MRIVIRNRWTGDEIYAADADSLRAVVVQCVRELGIGLTDADLRGADLRGADLTGAVLTDAAVLTEVTIACLLARATRLDGYEFRLFALDSGTHLIIAGCRRLTVEQYRAHVAAEYPGSAKASETFDILDFFAARIAHHQPQATTPA